MDEPHALLRRGRGLPSRYHADGLSAATKNKVQRRGDTSALDPIVPPDPHGRRGPFFSDRMGGQTPLNGNARV
jgi:hypothetical protein